MRSFLQSEAKYFYKGGPFRQNRKREKAEREYSRASLPILNVNLQFLVRMITSDINQIVHAFQIPNSRSRLLLLERCPQDGNLGVAMPCRQNLEHQWVARVSSVTTS